MESGIDGAARALARARRGRIAGALLAQAIVLAALLFVFLHGWDRDFTVPIGFSRDSLSAALQSKSTKIGRAHV